MRKTKKQNRGSKLSIVVVVHDSESEVEESESESDSLYSVSMTFAAGFVKA